MSYGLHRYEGGNTAALVAVPDTARNVGAVFAYDEWTVSRYLTVGYGAHYAHYDYLLDGRRSSARASARRCIRRRRRAFARRPRAR